MTDQFESAAEVNDPEAGIPRDHWGRYVLPGKPLNLPEKLIRTQLGRIYGVAFTRATTFAKTVSDTYALNMWGRRMAVKGLTMDKGLYALAASTPLTEIEALNGVAEKAAELAGSKTRASIGTALHAFTEQVDRGEHPHVPALWAPEIAAYTKLCEDYGLTFTKIERVVVLPSLGVAGTFDRVVKLTRPLELELAGLGTVQLAAGDHMILDLKTGRDLSYGWGEIAIQLALYANARLAWIEGTKKYEAMPVLNKKVGLVIHLPVRESEDQEARATLHAVNLESGWAATDLCTAVRLWRSTRNLASEVAVASVPGEVAKAVAIIEDADPDALQGLKTPAELRPPTWAERIAAASSPGELTEIWKAARAKGEWTPELEAAGHAQMAKIRSV